MYSTSGQRISQSTGLDVLLQNDFEIEVNDIRHRIQIPEEGIVLSIHPSIHPFIHLSIYPSILVFSVPLDGEKSLSDAKNMIHKLYTSLNVDRHQVNYTITKLILILLTI